MMKFRVMPVLAAVILAACGGDGTTAVDTTPKVRFFNTVWNAPDGIGFTANGQFAAGSALSYNQPSASCTTLNPGNTSFAIGVANPNRTGLSSEAIVTLTNQNVTAGGNYTVLAGGNVIHPSVVMLNNDVSGTLGANQAAVRFVNLAASVQYPFDVLKGTTAVHTNIAFRDATPFSIVTSGSNAYTIMSNGAVDISGSEATLNFQAGSVNTVVIVRLNPPDGKFQLINVLSCS